MKAMRLFPAVVLVFAACGGSDAPDAAEETPAASAPAAAAEAGPPSGVMTTPEWFQVDDDAQTVNMTITAGATPDNNYWNFNGATKGSIAVTVPEGYTVSITLVNNDPNMGHSIGVSAETNFSMPPMAEPVFAGAISENPTSMIDSTMPGESETLQFVADAAGNYTLVCFIPGHATIGMWIYFNVSADGTAGVQGE